MNTIETVHPETEKNQRLKYNSCHYSLLSALVGGKSLCRISENVVHTLEVTLLDVQRANVCMEENNSPNSAYHKPTNK